MNLRSRIAAIVAASTGVVVLFAGPAAAQDYPGTTVAPAPPICTGTITANAALLPLASVTFTATGTCLAVADTANGTLNSTPIALPTVPVVNNTASFPVQLPADWELNAFHTINVTDADTGALLLTNRFYVDGKGRITAPPKSGAIPRTGSSTDDLAKGGVALLAVGAAAVYAARRRHGARATAGV